MDEKSIKKAGKKSGIKPVMIVAIILILAAVGVTAYMYTKKTGVFAQEVIIQQRTAFVDKGSIEKSVEGSGSVQSSTRREISPKVVSTIESISFKVGDVVKTGDVMFELDDTEALLDIEDIKNSIGQTELTLADIRQSIASLTVKAPINGKVTEINAVVDGNTGGGASILTITDTSKVKILFQFGGNKVPDISIGHKATVTIQTYMSSYEGKVTYVSNKPYSSEGVMVYDVEITMDNQGAFTEGIEASARLEIGSVTYTSLDYAQTEFVNSKIVKNDSGGKVKNVNVKVNQFVNAGDVLVVLENDSLKLNLNTAELKLKNLNSQLSIKEKTLEYYKLVTPCNGTVISQSTSIGDTVSAGSKLAVVADMDSLVFDINIDELDVSDIEVGQEVAVTADAVTDTLKNPLKGTVSEISMEGTSSNGVTTYPVTITLEKSDKLKTGMNVNGEIMIYSKEDILRVPVEAIKTIGESSNVYVKGEALGQQNNQNIGLNSTDSSDAGQSRSRPPQGQGNEANSTETGGDTSKIANPQQGAGQRLPANAGNAPGGNSNPYYEGSVLTKVEIGISNDTYIEILSGLTEGQIIVLPEAGTDSESNDSEEEGMRGMQNGMRMEGGMPAGGPGF